MVAASVETGGRAWATVQVMVGAADGDVGVGGGEIDGDGDGCVGGGRAWRRAMSPMRVQERGARFGGLAG
jgi:hypothetical protein